MTGPLHPKALGFNATGIFDGLSSFMELENRICGLPTEKSRGDAFEVFAEAYLATQPLLQSLNVWPQEALPGTKRDLLALTTRDMGVDGVIETILGEYHAYQVKFRSGRAPLPWQELSTFMGLSDRADQRILFTNSNDLPSLMNSRTGFYCIRGSDLDRLDARDLEAIQKWLESGEKRSQRKSPLLHQQEALNNILPALERHNRVTTVMACGTGKTLLELWIAEKMGCRSVLVLVPSLALVRQTLHEWLRETNWSSLAYLCVCSDPSVVKGIDPLVVHQTDLDFPVTTSPEAVRDFMGKAFGGVRILFSTYQSASVVAEGMRGLPQLELGIFDEAHKTAGREGARFAFALKDQNLPITKRLFLTATPRHYDVQNKDKEGDSPLVFSMDSTEVYGPVVHTLTFHEAARRDIICGYKVIISVASPDMVNDYLLRHGEVIVDGDPVKVRQVAHQISIQKCVEEFGVSKIFTFHRSVASAQSFVAAHAEGIGSHLPEFKCFHVNGDMRTSVRDEVMQEFRLASKAVASNARCLTEGVDVPAVDMVAFLSPKKSRVDIVQATGRAMRRSGLKTTGYVLVPLFLDQVGGESLEEAFTRSDFSDLWDVLAAMQDQDEVLQDIIQEMREALGRSGGFDDQRLRERLVILAPAIGLESLRKAISVASVDRLGHYWDEMFGCMAAYKSQFGDCQVPNVWPTNPSLGLWVANQRQAYRKGKLSIDRIRRLEGIGFSWNAKDTSWEEMFTLLTLFRDKESHCNVPILFPGEPTFGWWVSNQRQAYKKGQLDPERIVRLEAIGFDWDTRGASWEGMFTSLKTFKEKEDHCNVPQKLGDNTTLGKWVNFQRVHFKQGKLSEDRISRLEALGFVWDQRDAAWEEMFLALVKFKEKEHHCNVSDRWADDPSLASWVSGQRQAFKDIKLSDVRIKRLEALGLVWDIHGTYWGDMYKALGEFKDKEHHCNVPANWTQNRPLSIWVSRQRWLYKKGKLSPERITSLEAIGFEWDSRGVSWEGMYEALVAFKQRENHCNVPAKSTLNRALGGWVSKQRQAYKKGNLTQDRILRLEVLGFVWAR